MEEIAISCPLCPELEASTFSRLITFDARIHMNVMELFGRTSNSSHVKTESVKQLTNKISKAGLDTVEQV